MGQGWQGGLAEAVADAVFGFEVLGIGEIGFDFAARTILNGLDQLYQVKRALYDIIKHSMKTTRYFEERVLAKRPYLKREWCERALNDFTYREVQPEDGRIRYWIFIEELGKYLRVITLEDGETVHNAFPDRNFKERPS